MCGIAGIISFDPAQPADQRIVERICSTMIHRGPDDYGIYGDPVASIGMRRLSIIDLSTGHQPISNEDGTVWLVFNGEIYNYRELRRELERAGHLFATLSDSEVIVHAYEQFGDRCLDRLNGMFAIALWDTRRRRLLMARDRLGIKPLYYWSDRGQLVFASELKALLAHPSIPCRIDLSALDQFLTIEYVPGPRSILEGVRKLPPAHLLLFEHGKLTIERYWDIPDLALPTGEDACAEQLRALIDDAVRGQLASDVPLGAFLSGGLDSSTILAFMRQHTAVPVQTFSIGFEDHSYNELPYARAVAAHFGTAHREAVLQPDIADLAETLVGRLDEPLADFSIFPTYLVSRLARGTVKVVLSGDGGDELFGGYESYLANQADRIYRRLPGWVRTSAMPSLMDWIPPAPAKKGLVNKAKRFVEGAALPPSLQHTRWMMFLNERQKARLYEPALELPLDGATVASVMARHFREAERWAPLTQQQYVDIKTYLADDILTKVDRMSMAVSLEARVPLLDHRIVEFAINLHSRLKVRDGQTKVILRRAMAGRLPEAILRRPKQGFSIPLKHWLGGPLRPLMCDLLSEQTLRRRGYFAPECVTAWQSEHLSGRANHSHRLWALMVFELWHQRVLDKRQVGAHAVV